MIQRRFGVHSPHSITILQRILPHYRHPFFTQLQESLANFGIQLRLIYGQEYTGTIPTTLPLFAPWARKVRNQYLISCGWQGVWQNTFKKTNRSEAVILEHSNRILDNYLFLLRRAAHGSPVAFWGHGANLQAKDSAGLSERIKRFLITHVDWWFAYTPLSVRILSDVGFSSSKITNVENSIDVEDFSLTLRNLQKITIDDTKRALGITGNNVAIFCGGMYPEKCLEFLLQACIIVRKRIPDFHILFLGNGPSEFHITNFCNENPWGHYVGPIFGPSRAVYFAISRALLIPGLVGLGILDSFVAETPLITSEVPFHSPEIAYLSHGVNGIMTPHRAIDFAMAVVDVLSLSQLENRLHLGCRESARRYTLANMVKNFTDGVLQFLNSFPPKEGAS